MTTPVAAPPPARIELDTTDSDRAIEHLNQAYRTSLRVSGAQDGHRFCHVRADAGLFALDDVRLPLQLGSELKRRILRSISRRCLDHWDKSPIRPIPSFRCRSRLPCDRIALREY